jgi:hypothetical protein
MAATYDKIATTTLGAGANSINFTSIGSGYTDLRLTFIGKSQPTNTRFPAVQFNSDTSALYSDTFLQGNGSAASSSRNTGFTYIPLSQDGMDDTTSVFYTIDIFSYAGSTFKTCLITSSEDKNGSGRVVNRVGLYRSTSAITAVNLIGASGTGIFGTGCIATLYGILKA